MTSHYHFQTKPIHRRIRVNLRKAYAAKRLRVDVNAFENGEEKFRFQTKTNTCGRPKQCKKATCGQQFSVLKTEGKKLPSSNGKYVWTRPQLRYSMYVHIFEGMFISTNI